MRFQGIIRVQKQQVVTTNKLTEIFFYHCTSHSFCIPGTIADGSEAVIQNEGNSKVSHPLQNPLCLSALKVLQVYVRDMGATLPADQFKVTSNVSTLP